MLRVLGRALCREPLFRRGHRHRRTKRQRPAAAGAELGAVPGLGKGPLHRFVAALFFRQPVLALRRVDKANGSRERAPDDKLRVPTLTLQWWARRKRAFAHPAISAAILHFDTEALVSASRRPL